MMMSGLSSRVSILKYCFIASCCFSLLQTLLSAHLLFQNSRG